MGPHADGLSDIGSRKVEPRIRKDSPSKQRRKDERVHARSLDEIYAMPVTSAADAAEQHAAIEKWKRRNAELCRVYTPSRPTPVTSTARVERRPRERREQRHTARSTSSGDSGDPDSDEPASGRLEDKINAAARKRQAAWALGDRRLTDQIGDELDRLYGKLRDKRKGDPGAPFAGRSASFVSPPARSPRPWGETAR